MSFPFRNKFFTFTQPDGTTIQVRGSGDQHYAVFETLDGYTLIKDPITNFLHYAFLEDGELKPSGFNPDKIAAESTGLTKGLKESREVVQSKVYSGIGFPPGKPRWQIRREQAKLASITSLFTSKFFVAPPQRQTVGDFIGLCLLIQFPDVPGTITREEVELFCNQKGYNGFGNNGSVYDYFFENSKGKLRYNNIVAPYYTAKHPRYYYTNEAIPDGVRATELIKEALDYHKSKGFDFSQLTSDIQDNVFATNVFYAGNIVNNWPKGLWPHQWYLNTPYPLAHGKRAFDYQISNMGGELTLGTFCHENGHMICDFPDLYDRDKQPIGKGIGLFCLMCVGGVLDEKNPAQICAYLKFKAGWADQVTEITSRLDAAISSQGNEFFIYAKNATEYLIIENRIQAGRDNILPDSGLAIWHVDEFGDNSNEQMTPFLHYECSLIQADGENHLETGDNDGDKYDLFDAVSNNHFGANTTPQSAWWDGTPSGLEIFNISQAGQSMTFSADVIVA